MPLLSNKLSESKKRLAEMRGQLVEAQKKLAATEQSLKQQIATRQKLERQLALATQKSQPTKPSPPAKVLVKLQNTVGQIALTADGKLDLPSDLNLPPELEKQVKELLMEGTVSQPKTVQLALAETGSGTILRGTEFPSHQVTEFPIPLNPVATAVKSTHPMFRWTPVKGAQSYRLIITNRDQTEIIWQVEIENRIQIQLPIELKRDEIYSWQVEAKVGDEVKLSQWAKFWVLDKRTFAQVSQLERKFSKSITVMAIVYQTYGLYDEAWTQLERLKRLNPDNPPVKSLIESLLKQRGGR